MPPLSRRRDTCCLCESPQLEVVLPLEPSPIGDAFVTAAERDVPQPFLPLDVALCRACGHAQLQEVVNPRHLFVDYLFLTGNSAGLVEHFRRFAETMQARFSLKPGESVLEIGSNDGSLLQFFQQQGVRVQGVDPSLNAARAAAARGVPTANTFFTSSVAEELLQDGPFRLVIANNVFAHSADLADMTAGIARVLTDDGVFVFEVSYLVDIVDRMLFDTIYHEHVSYHTLQPLVAFFRRFGLEVWNFEQIASKGGSLRCYVQRVGGPWRRTNAVDEMLSREQTLGAAEPEYLRSFGRRLLALREELHRTFDSLRIQPGTLVGYGASPTTTTLMAHFQLAKSLKLIVDDSPTKQGRFAPGWHTPVVSSAVLREQKPPFVLVLAWNYAAAIMDKQRSYRDSGGRFIVPLPQISLVGSDS
ncbi:MAG TPA: class I SAM-dependent methyltransferase [Planctomycetaceae bacterium]|nr:class I SAM-dependent methyltransferase [Planctomycetaceae bacterium]